MMSAYSILSNLVKNKIQILKDDGVYLEKVEANALIHYKKPTIDKAMKRIIDEYPDYNISYMPEINCVSLTISIK
ncbi:hypothetical protein A4G20_00740 [Pasteurellaceae bacterium RH1A]|nr:hypothetical protein A4G20_00740 [Pasteurellaceae bacterium RH1A]